MRLTKDKMIILLIFIFTFSVYLMTLAPTITSEDSGDFINCAHKLVIAHPTGYPLYCITGKLFTFLPIRSIAYRINLMSAFFASLASIFVFLIMNKLINNNAISITSSLLFSFSNSIWSQAVIAEVYTLNIFFFTLLVYLAIQYDKDNNIRTLYLLSFVYGLSLTNHVMNLFYLPAFVFYFNKNIKNILKKQILIKLFILFFIGLSLYLFVPIAIAKTKGSLTQLPYYDPSKPISKNVIDVISAKLYRSQTEFTITFTSILLRSKSLFFQFFNEISILILFSIFGATYLYKKNKHIFFFLMLVILTDLIYTLFINIYPMYITKYGFHSLFVLILLSGYGIFYIFSSLGILDKKIHYAIAFIVLIPLISNYSMNNQSNNWLTYNYGKDMITSIPERSFAYLISDDAFFPLNFHLTIDKKYSKKISAFYEGAVSDKKQIGSYLSALLKNEKKYNGMFYIPDFRNLEIQYYDSSNNPFNSYYQQDAYFSQFGIIYVFSSEEVKSIPINPWSIYNNSGFEDPKIPKNYIDTIRIIYYYQMLINQKTSDEITKEFAKKQIPHIGRAIKIVEKGYSGFVNEERALLMLDYLLANSNLIMGNEEIADKIAYKLDKKRLINSNLVGLKDILVDNIKKHRNQ